MTGALKGARTNRSAFALVSSHVRFGDCRPGREVSIAPASPKRARAMGFSGGAASCPNEIMACMAMTLTAVYMKVQEGYIAFIEELPGANTQGETLAEARENLNEAVALVLEANRVLVEKSLEGATVIRETFALPAA